MDQVDIHNVSNNLASKTGLTEEESKPNHVGEEVLVI